MNEALPLPELHEGTLDEAALEALLEDILRETHVLSVLVKGAAMTLAEGGCVTLADAITMLREGRVRAVQVRYEHRGQTWSDTLLRGPEGVRIVRMAI